MKCLLKWLGLAVIGLCAVPSASAQITVLNLSNSSGLSFTESAAIIILAQALGLDPYFIATTRNEIGAPIYECAPAYYVYEECGVSPITVWEDRGYRTWDDVVYDYQVSPGVFVTAHRYNIPVERYVWMDCVDRQYGWTQARWHPYRNWSTPNVVNLAYYSAGVRAREARLAADFRRRQSWQQIAYQPPVRIARPVRPYRPVVSTPPAANWHSRARDPIVYVPTNRRRVAPSRPHGYRPPPRPITPPSRRMTSPGRRGNPETTTPASKGRVATPPRMTARPPVRGGNPRIMPNRPVRANPTRPTPRPPVRGPSKTAPRPPMHRATPRLNPRNPVRSAPRPKARPPIRHAPPPSRPIHHAPTRPVTRPPMRRTPPSRPPVHRPPTPMPRQPIRRSPVRAAPRQPIRRNPPKMAPRRQPSKQAPPKRQQRTKSKGHGGGG